MRFTIGCMLLWLTVSAHGVEIQSICRLKGQEPVTLRGIGLVTGLAGTGDQRIDVTSSALARSLELMGNPALDLRAIAAARNVAIVAVECTVPAEGGREGEMLDCFVTSIGNSRGLLGGRLMMTALTGPRVDDQVVYGIAKGPLSLEGLDVNHARIEKGVTLSQDLFAPFVACGDRITLVIDQAHASMTTSDRIARRINDKFSAQQGGVVPIAQAIDAKNVEVLIPPFHKDNHVAFAADVLSTVLDPDSIHTQARVVINEKSATIVVTGEVEIKPLMVAHRNLLVFGPAQADLALQAAQQGEMPNNFSPLVAAAPTEFPPFQDVPGLANLNDLLFAMDRAQVTAEDKIAIIKELDKSGKLHALVIYE
jgi:flagellar P-ring protein precursor FlgI